MPTCIFFVDFIGQAPAVFHKKKSEMSETTRLFNKNKKIQLILRTDICFRQLLC